MAIGRHISELNLTASLPVSLKQVAAQIGQLFRLGGKDRIIARKPYTRWDIVGAVGKPMFWNPEKVKELVRQVEI